MLPAVKHQQYDLSEDLAQENKRKNSSCHGNNRIDFYSKEKTVSVSTFCGLCLSFSSLGYDLHATRCNQSNLANKPHFGIDLAVSSSVSCTIGAGE